jgi:hypothetical protein
MDFLAGLKPLSWDDRYARGLMGIFYQEYDCRIQSRI